MQGIITKGVGGLYQVRTSEGCFPSRARGKFRNINLTPVVGDRVEILTETNGEAVIQRILPRRNLLIRPPVANIDRLCLVVAAAAPAPDLFFIDKMSVAALSKNIQLLVCINKTDKKNASELAALYQSAGFSVFLTCAKEGRGIDALREAIHGSVTAFAGMSGVGKSSLLNALCPGLVLHTSQVSQKIARGRHTTRHVELFSLDETTYVFDTPGFSSFDAIDVTAEELVRYFPDFLPYLPECRYADCSHTKELECGVAEAVKAGHIAPSRHESYQKIYALCKAQKEWK